MPSVDSDEIACNGNVADKIDLDIKPAIAGELVLTEWEWRRIGKFVRNGVELF